MRFVQGRPGENYHTDDDARIYFRRTADGAPTHLRCVGMGFALSAHSDAEFEVELAPLELIGVGTFGAGRPTRAGSNTKWTGDSHKYGVYKHRGSLLILESHGGGEQGYYDRFSHAIELFDELCTTLPPERIWDICHLIATTQNQAYRKGRHEMAMLFLQNRLKRRKRHGHYRLEVLPESTVQPTAHIVASQ
ncbi:MAG TPA: hypothetical protein VFP59_19645 [Candidatus Angelobacter sp.]|nr:hypothetical protein [Candidatus Angelobacter sp.]